VQWGNVSCFPKTLGNCLAPRKYSLRIVGTNSPMTIWVSEVASPLVLGAVPADAISEVATSGEDAVGSTTERPVSVSRFSRCRSVRMSEACWYRRLRSFSRAFQLAGRGDDHSQYDQPARQQASKVTGNRDSSSEKPEGHRETSATEQE